MECEYIGSYVREESCPEDGKPEFAFIGRSNVGKSSLINLICNRKDLAKVSAAPGKTKTMNYFDIDKSWYLVDLPGYGYAKVSKTERLSWQRMINYYLFHRKTLMTAFILIDCSISPQEIDLAFIRTLGEHQVPFSIVYTKSDKVNQEDCRKNVKAFETKLSEDWEVLPNRFMTSAKKRIGEKAILEYIKEVKSGKV